MSMGAIIFVVAIIAVVAFVFLVFVVKNLLYVAQPNEVLIFSGRHKHQAAGRTYHYRLIKGGRAVRIPILETVDRVDLTNMIIEVQVHNAYSKGGIPLTVQGVANVKIAGVSPLLENALERFLGVGRQDIMRVARETLEGNLRGVLATLSPEQVNEDKEAFASKLTEEAEHDLHRIGIMLDTLKIQNVTDEVGYLDAIGRMRSADIRKRAQVAEAEAQAEAATVKWDNFMQGEVADLASQIEIARKENERRIADARTKREAMIAEERAVVQAAIAQSLGEVQMQEARIEQVRLQLNADVIRPATANKEEAIAQAKADAVKIVEQGKATADVLKDLATKYRNSDGAGRDVLLMQKLQPVLANVSGTIGQIHVDKLTVIGKGADGGGSLAGSLVNLNEQFQAATGVDVAGALKDRATKVYGAVPPAPPKV